MDLARIAWCFLSPRGRLTRQEFLLAYILLVIIDTVAVHLAITATPVPEGTPADIGEPQGTMLGFFLLATAWPSCAIQWKRLQDIGWPGYLVLPVGFAAVGLIAVNVWAGLLALVAILVGLAGVNGQAGDNRYGSDPLAP